MNGVGLGIGATMLGLADLVFMSTEARLKCPFTSLAVAPEAASSVTFPLLLGRYNATWALMSSEWLSAEECHQMGLAWKLCPPAQLLETTLAHARILAAKPISSLIETKQAIVAPVREEIAAARLRENDAYRRLLGAPANLEALRAFAEKLRPRFRLHRRHRTAGSRVVLGPPVGAYKERESKSVPVPTKRGQTGE